MCQQVLGGIGDLSLSQMTRNSGEQVGLYYRHGITNLVQAHNTDGVGGHYQSKVSPPNLPSLLSTKASGPMTWFSNSLSPR